MLKVLLIIILSSFSLMANAQEAHYFRGKIYADSIVGIQINIVNRTSETGVVNDVDGNFSIEANVGDELIFSSVTFQPYEVTLTQKMLDNPKNNIFLFPEVNELETVNLSDLNLTGNLNKDIETVALKPYWGSGREPKTTEERELMMLRPAGMIDGVIGLLNGNHARYKRIEAIYEMESRLNVVRRALPASFYTNDLELPKAYIDDFLYFCNKDEAFQTVIDSHQPLTMIHYLTNKVDDYRDFKEWTKN